MASVVKMLGMAKEQQIFASKHLTMAMKAIKTMPFDQPHLTTTCYVLFPLRMLELNGIGKGRQFTTYLLCMRDAYLQCAWGMYYRELQLHVCQ